MQSSIYTIGHSNQEVEKFLALLKDKAIQVIVDVRSAPYSRYVPHFNKHAIESALNAAGLKYIFMGDMIGGKPSGPQYPDANRKFVYAQLAAAETFQQGLDRLVKGLNDGWTIALMCAEEDPSKCHRHHLIANELEMKRTVPVWHIFGDGTTMRAKKLFEDMSGQMKLF